MDDESQRQLRTYIDVLKGSQTPYVPLRDRPGNYCHLGMLDLEWIGAARRFANEWDLLENPPNRFKRAWLSLKKFVRRV